MQSLLLNDVDNQKLAQILASLEETQGADYAFDGDKNANSCKCSGPAQSCAWH